MCTCTRVVYKFCNHIVSCQDLQVLMHWYTCKYLLNTLGRAVEQLAGCLASKQKSVIEVKIQQSCNAELVAYFLMNI